MTAKPEPKPEPAAAAASGGAAPPGAPMRPIESSLAVERSFRVDGKKVTVKVVFPAAIGKEIGLANVYECVKRVLVELDGKQSTIVALKLGEN